jgi:hypothetical protein
MADEIEENGKPKQIDEEVAEVVRDFEERTLDGMKGYFNRLIYLASLRDYNTGRYHHYGLETRHGEKAVDEALRRCHTRTFENLVSLPLKEQTEDLLNFFESFRDEKERLPEVWQRLRSYQVLPPEKCHPMARALFDKNVEIILRILRETDLWPLLHDPHRDPDDLP